MSDLVKRLTGDLYEGAGFIERDTAEAAARILELEADNALLREALGQHDGDLNERMAALGMVPLDKLLSVPPTPFSVHAAMKDMDSFVWWVNSKNREYTTMRLRYEIWKREKNDDLYEWVFAHSAVFGAIADNLRAALEAGK